MLTYSSTGEIKITIQNLQLKLDIENESGWQGLVKQRNYFGHLGK